MRSEERRLHPLSLLFSLGTGAGRFLLPMIFVLFAARGGQWDLWFTFLIFPYAVASILRYLTYRYEFRPEDLAIRSGLLFHNERRIPYERIHNVGTVRNLFHRLFGVADVRLETAGGQEPEARIQVLGMEAVDEMRRRVFAQRGRHGEAAASAAEAGAAAPAGAEGATLFAMGPWDVAFFGLVESRGGVVVAAAVGVAWELAWQFNLIGDNWFAPTGILVSFFKRSLGPLSGWGLALAVVAGLIGLVALFRLFSIVWAFMNLYGFKLTLSGNDLSTSRGLFTRVATSIPLHRIQVVVVRESPLHRWLGYVEVKVETAGGSREEERRTGQEWLTPLLPKERIQKLLGVVEPGLDLQALPWQPLHARAARRILVREGIVAALIPIALAGLIGWWSVPLFAALLLSAGLQARHQPRHMAFAVPSAFVAWRSGWLWRKLSVARVSKIQSVTVSESPFDRRHAMAGVRVDTAGAGSSAHRIRIPFLDASLAREVAAGLASRAEASEFRW